MGSKKRNNGRPSPAAPEEIKPEPARRASKRWLAIVAALVVVAVVSLLVWRTRSQAGDPDIILVTIDTLRADCVGFSGKSHVKTPFLDELAGEGIYFTNAHSHNVVTFPSHTNILTGLLPYQHGMRDNAGFVLDPKFKTVAAALKQHGYATGAFVSAFPLDARVGLNADFDVYDDKYPEGTAPTKFTVPERPASETLAAAQAWYDRTSQKKFMWVHIYEPHVPYNPPSPFKEQYPGKPYYGEVATADHALGEFLRPILAKNPNTLVILTADHGEGMGEHGEVTHGLFAYEETLHIPLIIVEKGRIKPRIEKAFVRHVDIVPTILDRLGIPKPKELTGETLLKIKGERNTYFEALTASINLGWAPLYGMIHDGHKYVELPIPELYDLPHDPLEKNNTVKENRRMTNRIRQLLSDASPNTSDVKRGQVSSEEASKLMALGYLTGTAAAKKTYTADDDPKNLVPFYSRMNKAVTLYQEGKWDEAVDVARKLLAERPEMTMARDIFAFILQQTEHNQTAEKVLRDAIASGNASDTMKSRLGLLLSEEGRAKEAVEILSQFANSKDPELLNAYGIALADLGRIPEGIHQFEEALRVDPTNATAFQNLGVVALRVNDLPRARQFIGKALSLNDKMPLALNTLGVLEARENDLNGAADAWRRAIAIDPRQYDALFNLGLVAGQAGRKDEARRVLTQFVKTAPHDRYERDIAAARQALAQLQ